MDEGATGRREMARLRWQCRRGMRELDLLLEDFLATRYETLDEAQRRLFRELLTCPDQLLLEYLMGRLVPSDREVAALVRYIRSAH